MSEKIIEGLYLVASSTFSWPGDCECYFVKTGENVGVLIDAGADPEAKGIIKSLEELGFVPTHLILTHAHIDHIGGAHALKKKYGCRVVAHELDREPIENYDPVRTAADLYRIKYTPVKVDEIVKEDEVVLNLAGKEFTIHYIPGHTPGSIAVSLTLKGKKVLFAQDIHGPFHKNWGSDTLLWREAVEKLIQLKADILCEGHFGVFQPKEKARQYLEGFLQRMA